MPATELKQKTHIISPLKQWHSTPNRESPAQKSNIQITRAINKKQTDEQNKTMYKKENSIR